MISSPKKGQINPVSCSLLLIFMLPVIIFAQGERAGTHLDSNAVQSTVLELYQADEIEAIRKFLESGRLNDALNAANEYVVEVEFTTRNSDTTRRYYAYNALCTVLTRAGELDEAISACTTAMELEPRKWSAVNNRGTARLMQGQLDQALQDYEQALNLAPEGNENIAATILHNISLVQQRSQQIRN